jgi:UDP-N-acetylmuramate: L-alanyl-gamma-D-glutamyl-meso-diaminopimelate ligase
VISHQSLEFDYLFNKNLNNSALLLMSSGNYGGLNFDEVKELLK